MPPLCGVVSRFKITMLVKGFRAKHRIAKLLRGLCSLLRFYEGEGGQPITKLIPSTVHLIGTALGQTFFTPQRHQHVSLRAPWAMTDAAWHWTSMKIQSLPETGALAKIRVSPIPVNKVESKFGNRARTCPRCAE